MHLSRLLTARTRLWGLKEKSSCNVFGEFPCALPQLIISRLCTTRRPALVKGRNTHGPDPIHTAQHPNRPGRRRPHLTQLPSPRPLYCRLQHHLDLTTTPPPPPPWGCLLRFALRHLLVFGVFVTRYTLFIAFASRRLSTHPTWRQTLSSARLCPRSQAPRLRRTFPVPGHVHGKLVARRWPQKLMTAACYLH
jgi:hypothetical protein